MPAVAARAATAWPSRVSEGLASAAETGRSTSLGKDAQPVTQMLSSSSRHSHRRLAESRGADKAKEEAGYNAAVLMGMMQATLA